MCAPMLKAHCAFSIESSLPHRFAFSRYALSEKARRCDTPACAQPDSEYSSYSVRGNEP
ncbi:hypothetical protein HMPREF1585_01409, partial [Gardnerella vaginalis JCP8481B]